MSEFTIPELGEGVTGGDVAKVMVKAGDTIAVDQPVLELETDKATIEVPSSVAGVVKDIRIKKGDKIAVGAVVLTVEDGQGSTTSSGAASTDPASANAGEARSGQRDEAVAVSADTDRPAAEGSSQRTAPAEQPSPGKASEQKVVAMPQRPSAVAAPAKATTRTKAAPRDGGEEREAAGPAPASSQARAESDRAPAAPAAPSVRRLAREIGVGIDDVQGSGPGGRISQEDVKEYARRIVSSVGGAGASAGVASSARALPDFEKWGEVDRQSWSNIRRSTSEHLTYAWNTLPHVTQFDKADITAMEALRQTYRAQVEKAGGALTVTAMLVRVLATAVQKFPQFNSSLDPARGEIVFKKYVNIGIAVDTEWGLLVPVIRDVDRKNITEIAVEIQDAATRAREKKLTLEEMRGGGITISNLGGIGGTYFTPIVNWPEVAILGLSRGVLEPVWRNNAFEPRQMLPLSLSYDHRVIDGADAVRFLRWVVEAIEQPFLLSLIG